MDIADSSVSDRENNHDHEIENKGIHKYRRYLPQVNQNKILRIFEFVYIMVDVLTFQTLAALANNLVSLNNGLFDGFPSIVIPSLVGLNKELNPNETLRITASQASWIGKMEYFNVAISCCELQVFTTNFHIFSASCAFFVHPIGAFTGNDL